MSSVVPSLARVTKEIGELSRQLQVLRTLRKALIRQEQLEAAARQIAWTRKKD